MSENKKGWSLFQKAEVGLLITIGTTLITFYINWKTDEIQEDAESDKNKILMFDDAKQKHNVTDHVDEAIPVDELKVKMLRDIDFQEKMLEKLNSFEKTNKKQDCLLIRLNDQYYLLNQKDIHID